MSSLILASKKTFLTTFDPRNPSSLCRALACWGVLLNKMGWEAIGRPGFLGGGVNRALRPDPPPSPKKGSIDRTPKILPSLTPGLGGDPDTKKKLGKKENGIFGISASRGFRLVIICHIFGEKKMTNFSAQKFFWRLWCQTS